MAKFCLRSEIVIVWLVVSMTSCTFAPATDTAMPSPANTKAVPLSTQPKSLAPTPNSASKGDDSSTPTPNSPPVGLKVGDTAPDFSLQNLQGETVILSALRGQAVLINFWAVWCGFCRIEMPEIQAAYEAYGDKGFVVLGINVQEEAKRVERFGQDMGVTFPLLLDQRGAVTGGYRIRGLPTSIMIDPDGVIRIVHIGPISQQQITDYLAQMGIEQLE